MMASDAEAPQQLQDEAEQQGLLETAHAQEVVPRTPLNQGGAAGDGAERPPVAPDGGWSWLVTAAVAFICTATMGPAMSSPFVFADYMEEIGQGSQGMTTLLSIWMAFSCLSGLFCNKLFQRFSCRQVGWIGAVLMALGQGPVAFATHFVHFILANVCGGLGMGLVVTACFTAFNIYFHRRRTLAMGFTQLLMGLGMFGFPMLVQEMVARLGFRTAQCIICAINVSIIPVLVILKPLKKNSSRDGVTGDGATSQRIGNMRTEFSKLPVYNIDERTGEAHGFKQDKLNHVPSLQGDCDNDGQMTSPEQKKELSRCSDETQLQERPPDHSAVNLGMSHSVRSVKTTVPPGKRTRNTIRWWLTIVDLLDLKLLQDFTIANTLVGISLMFFVDMMFMMVIPLYLFNTGLSRSDSALAMSVMTFSDMGGRLSMAIIGACGVTKNRMLFLLGASLCVFFRSMVIFFTDFTAIVVLSVLMGVSRSYLTSTMPLVIGETCSKQRFPAAYGLHNVMSGVLYMALGPLIGLLKDVTSNFVASIVTLDVISLLCIVPWILEMIVTYRRKREKLSPNT